MNTFDYAVVKNGKVVGLRKFTKELKNKDIKHVGGKPLLLPLVKHDAPVYDAHFQQRNGPTFEITDAQVNEIFAVSFLPGARSLMKKAIDTKAEEMRKMFITSGEGQAMVYMEKARQARECLAQYNAENLPPAGTFRFLEQEIGINGETIIDVATKIITLQTEWEKQAANLEKTRLAAKKQIDDAVTDEDALVAFNAIVWSLV